MTLHDLLVSAMDGEQVVVICATAAPREAPPLPGWRRVQCAGCSAYVWLAVTSRPAFLDGAALLCRPCAVRLIDLVPGAVQIGRAPGADEELRRAGREDLVLTDEVLRRVLERGQR